MINEVQCTVKRVCDLKKGNVFIWQGTRFRVLENDGSVVKYRYLSKHNWGCTSSVLGAKSQMKVEICQQS